MLAFGLCVCVGGSEMCLMGACVCVCVCVRVYTCEAAYVPMCVYFGGLGAWIKITHNTI